MDAYSAVNYLVVLFAGQDPSELDNGVGWQACDSGHNLPPTGENFVSPVDYKAVYDSLWSMR